VIDAEIRLFQHNQPVPVICVGGTEREIFTRDRDGHLVEMAFAIRVLVAEPQPGGFNLRSTTPP